MFNWSKSEKKYFCLLLFDSIFMMKLRGEDVI